uniref:Uncharacterized protein n=1 Tax=Paramormyrops kingsleyae TaxID=1676925 RepID=A0A3B3Q370_9TELE
MWAVAGTHAATPSWSVKMGVGLVFSLALLWSSSSATTKQCFSKERTNLIINASAAFLARTTVLDLINVSPNTIIICAFYFLAVFKCNWAVYRPDKPSGSENCYLFYCEREEDCPLIPMNGVNSYNIFTGVDYPSMNHLTTTKAATQPSTTPRVTIRVTAKPTYVTTPSTPTATTHTSTAVTTPTQPVTTTQPTTTTITTLPPTITQPSISTTLPSITSTEPSITTTTTTTTTTVTTSTQPASSRQTTTTIQPASTTQQLPATTRTPQPSSTTAHTQPTTTLTSTTPTLLMTQRSAASMTPLQVTAKEAKSMLVAPPPPAPPTTKPGHTNPPKRNTVHQRTLKSTLEVAVVVGLVFLALVIALVGRKAMESFNRRQYTRLELNDLYYDV